MPSAAALRLQIETALEPRIPGALTPRPRIIRDIAATGVPELDALLEGGLPIGAISEFVGPLSSGRTTLAMAALAELTQAARTVAWVDVADALDPESAAAAGIDLERMLWVRCGGGAASSTTAGPSTNTASGPAFLVEGSRTPAPSGGCGSPHPRAEAKGMSQAIDAFLQPDVFSRPAPPRDPAVPRKNRIIGTPSAPNRTLMDTKPGVPFPRCAADREEQAPTDRQPPRRGSGMKLPERPPKNLGAAQIAYTGAVAGAWDDNRNKAAGRSVQTAPNAIAAGLPRFREMEARASGQGHGFDPGPASWKPSLDSLRVHQISRADHGQGKQKLQSSAQQAEALSATTTKKHKAAGSSLAGEAPSRLGKNLSSIWKALDQALRATDLLLAAGGFSAIVLDLGSTPPEFAWRIPLATWFRFRAAADRARTVFVLLTQHPCARSSAELVLRLAPVQAELANTVLTGARFHVDVDRRRFETQAGPELVDEPPQTSRLHLVSRRKPPQRERNASWQRRAAWTGSGAGGGR